MNFSEGNKMLIVRNRNADYYSPVGSYDGAIKWQRCWIRVRGLNRILKYNMIRWQGPPSKTIINAMKFQTSVRADELLPHLKRTK